MMGHNFDTHSVVKRFIKSGISEPQAEEIVKAITESREFDLSNLATKSDLHEMKADILKWMIGMQLTTIFGIVGAMIAIFKFMN